MSQDDFTPARLRELAAQHETIARNAQVIIPGLAEWHEATAAALRAAADELSNVQKVHIAMTATLAAREALLARCEPFVLACVTWSGDADECDRNEAQGLAAEIAAALKETDQ